VQRGRPSHTAFGAATHRAVHQDLEGGAVFADPLAWRILGIDRAQALAEARVAPGRRVLRLFIAARHRFAEDSLAAAVARGTTQAVVLGAGLDTFGYRNPHAGLRVWEVDHPDTGAWKRDRLVEAGIEVGSDMGDVRYVGVDFERDDLVARLAEAGLDPRRPTFFLWLGVVPYLTREAITATLTALGGMLGAEVVLDYPTGSAGLDAASRRRRERLAERTAAVGEPMLSSFEPDELAALLEGAGFDEVEDLGRREILTRVFGLPPEVAEQRAGAGGAHLCRARRTSTT
jgi:methyltransferase (TIGR00027 family)